MNFDELVGYYSKPSVSTEAKKKKIKAPKLYVPTEKAFEVGYPQDSVEAKIIQFLDEKPASMEELVAFLRQNYDEYNSVSIAKEKIRELLFDDILDFADETAGGEEEYGSDLPELETEPEPEFDITSYLDPCALDDWEHGQSGHF